MFNGLFIFFRNIYIFFKTFCKIYWLFLCKLLDLFKLSVTNLDADRADFFKIETNLLHHYNMNNVKSNVHYAIFKNNFLIFDNLFLLFFSKKYGNYTNLNLFRSYLRVYQTKQGFYFNFNILKNNSVFFNQLKLVFLSGLKSLWLGIRIWILSLSVGFSIIYYSMVLRSLPFNKTIFAWVAVGMFSYWLLSGFVFFVKKYQFGKFTSAIQRFWRRSYILFWLIEFSLFIVYVYLTVNANQESFYMFDQVQAYKTHLFSWRIFFLKIFPLILLLIAGYMFLLTLKWNILNKHSLWLALITVLLTYVTWVEFYQFVHVINFYGNFNWIYDIDERVWSLELEPRKTRTVNHYVMLMLILKFWHIVFIFAFWIFFVLRSLEIGRVRYPLLSANLQNFVILYLFAWVTMYPWLKFIFRKFLDLPYFWFYVNNRDLSFRVFFNDLSLFYYSILDSITYNYYNSLNNTFNMSFFYWNLTDESNLYCSYRKSSIKNIIVQSLNN